ncbi:MAG: hypothetical protein A2V70_04815 [Planctomycetes bacterium RBG_13_63_9]|nr:MAG: hypothetical protein A2V70_04815 [Planctomycetes bacterium RBG_13_63_9]
MLPNSLSVLCITGVACLFGQVNPLDQLDLPDPPPRPGAFARLLRESEYVRVGVFSADHAPGTEPTENTRRLRLPADFERQEALILVADKLAAAFPDVLVRIVATTRKRLKLVGLLSSPQSARDVRSLLVRHGLPADSIQFVQVPSDTMWVRDFGPVFVRSSQRDVFAFDFDYTRRSGRHLRTRDDSAASLLARELDIPARRVPMELEQGDLLSNGGDLLVTTSRAVNVNVSRGYAARTIIRSLQKMFGCRRIIVLEALQHEPTGHVDIFACFVDPGTIIIGEYDRAVDPVNAAVLDCSAAVLSSVQESGRAIRVVRLPMPGNHNGEWRTYANVVFANGVLLVPCYGADEADGDQAAVEIFRRVLPRWQVVPIDASALIVQEGALRCVTLNLPAKARRGEQDVNTHDGTTGQ